MTTSTQSSKKSANTHDKPLSEHARAVGDSVKDLGHAARDEVRERVAQTSEQARDSFDHAVDAVGSQVRARPLQSLLWTAGAGILIGMLIARRN